MLLADLAATSEAVAEASARNEKTALLGQLIGRMEPEEIEPGIGFLVGKPRQGRIGVGWATVSRVSRAGVSAADGQASLTLLDLDRFLDQLAATTGEGSASARDELLAGLMGRAIPVEHNMIRQVLTGEVRQGALAGVVTAAVAKAAGVKLTAIRRAVMLIGDLGVASRIALVEGEAGLDEVQLEVGRPIEPMLASTSDDVGAAIDSFRSDKTDSDLSLVSVEWKLDGIRIQVHRQGDLVRIFTRNLNDITDRLGGVADLVRSLPFEAAVLDGEVIGLVEDGSPRAFQDTMSDVGSEGSRGESGAGADGTDKNGTDTDGIGHVMTPFFFDIMHLDGEDMLDRSLRERGQALDRAVGGLRIPTISTSDPAAAARHFKQALAAGHEGVMVKSLDTIYAAGRRGKAWRKVKPVHTVDLLVMAAEWGHGRRSGRLSNLHLGARDPETGEFVMVGKTFKGLTDELLNWQTERFLQLMEKEKPEGVFLRPELVVEIAIDGVQRSSRYPGGVALRFARVKRYRLDRSPESVESIHDLRQRLV